MPPNQPQESDIRWASRWDTYLKMTDDQIHWFSIINSVMIVVFLSGMVAMIMMRTLRADIAKYNQLDQEDAAEETGWKLVRGGAAPSRVAGGVVCVCVGACVGHAGQRQPAGLGGRRVEEAGWKLVR